MRRRSSSSSQTREGWCGAGVCFFDGSTASENERARRADHTRRGGSFWPRSRDGVTTLSKARALFYYGGVSFFPYKQTKQKRLKTLTTFASLFKAVLVFDRHLFPHTREDVFSSFEKTPRKCVVERWSSLRSNSLSLSLERAREDAQQRRVSKRGLKNTRKMCFCI